MPKKPFWYYSVEFQVRIVDPLQINRLLPASELYNLYLKGQTLIIKHIDWKSWFIEDKNTNTVGIQRSGPTKIGRSMTKRLLDNPTSCSNKAAPLNAVPGLQHHHAVPSDHHHPNLVLRFLGGLWVNYLKRKKLQISDKGLHANHGPNCWHTCLVNSMESSRTKFMKGSKPQRVPSTWKNVLLTIVFLLSLLFSNSANLTPAINPEVNPLVHELFELWGVCLRHLGMLDKELWNRTRLIIGIDSSS